MRCCVHALLEETTTMAETQFVIPARNLKVFSKIVQCMAKIGDDLFFDVNTDKVWLLFHEKHIHLPP